MTDAAQGKYQTALKADAFDSVAEGDLALIEARRQNYDTAIRLWQSAFQHDPTQLAAGDNLAQVECSQGQCDSALAILDRVLLFSPDEQRALQAAIRSGSMSCAAK